MASRAPKLRTGSKVLQLEYQEQCDFIRWCSYQYFDFMRDDGRTVHTCLADAVVASLNGAALSGNKVQRAKQWKRLVRSGAKSAEPDLSVNVPMDGFAGLKIEMKKRREDFPSKSAARRAASPEQLARLSFYASLNHKTVLAFGWVEAAVATCNYMRWNATAKGLT